MTSRALDSDELGRKGEVLFEGICTDAKLVANRVMVDRKGWDSIVEWRQPDEATNYDDRDLTISARVQVKTVWEGRKSIRLRLSSAEALAKDHRPSFIYVPVVSDTLKFVGAYIIHLRGEFLRDILLRLRKARLDNKRPNQLFFSVPLTGAAEEIQPEGVVFRQFVETAVGGSMLDYAVAKQAELDVDKGAMRIATRLAIETDDPFDEVAEFFLGRRDAQIVDFAAFSTRFGIEIPNEGLAGQAGTMRLTPQPSTTCTLSLRRNGGQIIRFDGDLYRSPRINLSPPRGRIVVRTATFDLTLDAVLQTESGPASMEWSLDSAPVGEAKLAPEAWVDVCLFFAEVGQEGSTLEIHAHDVPAPITSTSMGLDGGPESTRAWQSLAELSQQAASVLRYAGLQSWCLPLEALLTEHHRIVAFNGMIGAPSSVNPIRFALEDVPPTTEWPDRMLYFDRLEFDGDALACAALMRLSPDIDGAEFTGNFDSIFRLERIEGTDERFFQFVDSVRTLAKIDNYYLASRTGS